MILVFNENLLMITLFQAINSRLMKLTKNIYEYVMNKIDRNVLLHTMKLKCYLPIEV